MFLECLVCFTKQPSYSQKVPEFAPVVFSRCAISERHCLPQVVITSINNLKIYCLSLSNEKGTVKPGLLNRASKSSSFDIPSV